MRTFSLDDVPTPEIDYNFLVGRLQGYRYPRNKINDLLRSGALVRVKKGLYVKGKEPYSLALLANLIYGPSYVSLDYALGWYSLVPERVHVVTSMTTGRRKHFRTPVGEFSYEPLPPARFAVGVRRVTIDDQRSFLIATPEKALLDKIWRTTGIATTSELEDFLTEDLRIDLDACDTWSPGRLNAIRRVYRRPIVDLLADLLAARRRE